MLVWHPAASPAVAAEADGCRYSIEADGLRYEYQAVLGVEGLFATDDAASARRDISRDRPEDTARLRAALAEALHVTSLEALRAPHRRTIDALHSLGYL